MTHKSEHVTALLPERKDSVISSVIVMPEKLHFETQNPHEQVYIMLRQHIVTNIGWVLTTLFLWSIPVILCLFLEYFHIDIYEFPFLKSCYVFVAIFLWYTLTLTNAFTKFLDWYFNIYIITNERILDFDFSSFAYHKISEAGLESIVDATQEAIGFIPMLFNYGDVYIQTSGEKREFDFTSVPNPAWVRDKIMDLRDLVVKKAR